MDQVRGDLTPERGKGISQDDGEEELPEDSHGERRTWKVWASCGTG